MVAEELDSEDEEVRSKCFPPPNNGEEDESEMHTFVEQYMLSLLSPVAEHVRDLEKQLDSLRGEVLAKSVGIGNNTALLRRHDQQLIDLTDGLTQASANTGRMNSELSAILEVTAKGNRERGEAGLARAEQDLRTLASQVRKLEEAHVARDEKIHELSLFERSGSSALANHGSELGQLKDSFDKLHQRELGLSSRLEKNKMVVDDACGALHRLQLTTHASEEELKKSSAQTVKRLERVESRFLAVQERVAAIDEGVDSLGKNVKSLNGAMALMDLMPQDDGHVDHEKAASKNAMERLDQRLVQMREELTQVTTDLHEEVSTKVDELRSSIGLNKERIDQHGDSILQLDESLVELRSQVHSADLRIMEQDGKQDALKEQTTMFEGYFADIFGFQKDVASRLEVHENEFGKVGSRFDCVEESVQALSADLNLVNRQVVATGDDVAKLAKRVDTSHNYLHGFTKGLQDVHRRVESGQDGMLTSKDRSQKRDLPALPGSTPRRPHTSLN
ncbi:unnamed protein product [Polarella glacialis]|uniref:Uncharacterized protein n=1 Tax=Polarella glacialis TaxID=89957 RepID=A0A813LTJ6_POLGL|nr:unnamed protein product [Polarella glacialis]